MPPVTLSVTIPGVGARRESASEPYYATYRREAPDNLLGQFPFSRDNINRFMSEIESFYRDTITRDFSPKCVGCLNPLATVFKMVMFCSFSDPNNLSVDAYCVPHCGAPKCELTAAQIAQAFATQRNSLLHKDCPEKQSSIVHECHNCGKAQSQQKLVCAQCNLTFYCNRACQRKHWPTHKPFCKASQEGSFSIGFINQG